MSDPDPRKPLRIAVGQPLVQADVRKNGSEIRKFMRRAREAGAVLAHFPEGALSGYAKTEIADWHEFNWDSLQRELDLISRTSAELGIWTVLGACHRQDAPARPHNSLYVFSPRGELVTRYDKRWCSFSELADWYCPGEDAALGTSGGLGKRTGIFEIDGWRFGCALCIEIQFPELFRDYEAAGVDCVLFSSYSDDERFGYQAQAHAATNCYWISVSVPRNTSDALSSRLISPTGEVIAECPRDQRDFIVTLLDDADPRWDFALNQARPWRAKAREGEIYRQALDGRP